MRPYPAITTATVEWTLPFFALQHRPGLPTVRRPEFKSNNLVKAEICPSRTHSFLNGSPIRRTKKARGISRCCGLFRKKQPQESCYGFRGFAGVASGRASAGPCSITCWGTSTTGVEFDGGLPIGTGCKIEAGRGAPPFGPARA